MDWLPVSEVKIVLASILLALALYQVAMMAVGYGRISVPFLAPEAASRAHRAVGDTMVVLTIVVAFLCVTQFEIEDDTAVHSAFGAGLLVALGLKIAVVRGWISGDRTLPWLGSLVLLLFAGAWASSAARYLV